MRGHSVCLWRQWSPAFLCEMLPIFKAKLKRFRRLRLNRMTLLRSRAKSASAELRECFHSGPEALRDWDSLPSRKRCLVYWEMHGSLYHSARRMALDASTTRPYGARDRGTSALRQPSQVALEASDRI